MRAVWREGITPLLQMHDCLDASVSSQEQGEMIARLGCEVVTCEVPHRVDLKFGRSWGDASHSWEELHGDQPHRNGVKVAIAIPVPPTIIIPPPVEEDGIDLADLIDEPVPRRTRKICCRFPPISSRRRACTSIRPTIIATAAASTAITSIGWCRSKGTTGRIAIEHP